MKLQLFMCIFLKKSKCSPNNIPPSTQSFLRLKVVHQTGGGGSVHSGFTTKADSRVLSLKALDS